MGLALIIIIIPGLIFISASATGILTAYPPASAINNKEALNAVRVLLYVLVTGLQIYALSNRPTVLIWKKNPIS
jgi:hypothetical protein